MAGLLTVTVTPGRTAPLASNTLPLMVPVELAPPPCGNECRDAYRQATNTATASLKPRTVMNILLLQAAGYYNCRMSCEFASRARSQGRNVTSEDAGEQSFAPALSGAEQSKTP